MEINDSKELKWPPRLRSRSDTRDNSKYCDFHRDHRRTTEDCFALKREIETLIKRGFLGSYITSGGDSSSGFKQYARQPPAISKSDLDYIDDITFGTGDLDGIAFLHDDALVISTIIANFEVKKILIDNGSIANVLSHEAFVQMGISLEQLRPITTFEVIRTPVAYDAILGRSLLNEIQAIVSTFHLAMKFPTSTRIEVVRGSQIVA
ncbi:uncharacterized protein LOC111376384 [Olea europaea var. sylvestris]|uniref:uncharacterized protein LOC111376384 n=1 Tax=Olea europaea var. sylvestris TaxID=158386 RepID=UPI000C1D1895|nr:uncharacterized protein LOC111376384 [Olea europaea var. sylvestris]